MVDGNAVLLFRNMDSSGMSWSSVSLGDLWSPVSSVCADLDYDGDIDVAACSFGCDGVRWWENIGGMGLTWREHMVVDSSGPLIGLSAADLDSDGRIDLVTSSNFVDELIYFEQPTATTIAWVPHILDCGQADNPGASVCVDCNSDEVADIVLTGFDSGTLEWLDVWSSGSGYENGELVSSVLDTGCDPAWGTISSNATVPSRCSVSFQVRSSDNPSAMGAWSDTLTQGTSLQGILADGESFLQYRCLLSSSSLSLTPLLEDVEMTWEPLGIAESPESNEFSLSLSSNPFTGSLYVYVEGNPLSGHLAVYDITGRLVRSLGDGQGGNMFPWDGRDASGNEVPAGTYLIQGVSAGRLASVTVVKL